MKFKVILVLVIGLSILGGCGQDQKEGEVISKETTENKEIIENREENKEATEDKEITQNREENKEATENKEIAEDEDIVENNEIKKETKNYFLAEVSEHNNEASCWTIVNGRVYNITSHISEHTGGERNIKQGCGIDATDIFVGKPHIKEAHDYLENFYIGDLE